MQHGNSLLKIWSQDEYFRDKQELSTDILLRLGSAGRLDKGYWFIQGRSIHRESSMILEVRESTEVLSVISFENRIDSM